MSRRRKGIDQSLDSLMDILSNVVGVMVLMAVIIVLNSQNVTLSLGSPILQEPPENARRLLFECRNNRVMLVNLNRLDEAVIEVQKKYREAQGVLPSARDLAAYLDQNDVGDQYYRVRLELKNGANFIYEPRRDGMGATALEIVKEDSPYQRMLDRLDGETSYLFFVVRPDSFDIFRTARAEATGAGLKVGWDPLRSSEPLRLRTGSNRGGQVQ